MPIYIDREGLRFWNGLMSNEQKVGQTGWSGVDEVE